MYNVLKDTTAWYYSYSNTLRGYADEEAFADAVPAFGTATGARVNGTDAVELKVMSGDQATVVAHAPDTAEFTVDNVAHGLTTGDIALVCDFRQSAVFQVSGATVGSSTTVLSHVASSGSTGNCTQYLAYTSVVNCDDASAVATNLYKYGCVMGKSLGAGGACSGSTWPAYISRVTAVRWYVGNNARGGRSLFRLNPLAGGAAAGADEIVEGVKDMAITYVVRGGTGQYVAASSVNWAADRIDAVRLTITLEGNEPIGAGNERLSRDVDVFISLRNQ
jgi:type IV pilus assembly protein PilW